MAEYGVVATIPVLMPHRRLRPRAADPSRPWNTTQPSPTSATRIGKRLAGKLHEPFERAGGGRAINPTSLDSTKCEYGNFIVAGILNSLRGAFSCGGRR